MSHETWDYMACGAPVEGCRCVLWRGHTGAHRCEHFRRPHMRRIEVTATVQIWETSHAAAQRRVRAAVGQDERLAGVVAVTSEDLVEE